MSGEGSARTTPRVKGNRLKKAQLVASGDTTTIGEYEYYGDNRRSKKVVSNHGPEVVANDGGNTTVLFYYCGTGLQPVGRWSICETRNGSNQTTFQYLWGTQYTDELIWLEKTLDTAGAATRQQGQSACRTALGPLCQEQAGDSPLTRGGLRSRPDRAAIAGRGPQARVKGLTESNDTNPDDQAGESTADMRYFVHQDRNWNVVALTEYDPQGTNDGRIAERYSYTPYGIFVVLTGDSGSGELCSTRLTSTIGNPFAHQGLPFDQEARGYHNRHRAYIPAVQRFTTCDPVGYMDSVNVYLAYRAHPQHSVDPLGLWYWSSGNWLCHCICKSTINAACSSGKLGASCCPSGDFLGLYGNCSAVCEENINRLVSDPEARRIARKCVAEHEDTHTIHDCQGYGGDECLPITIEGMCVSAEQRSHSSSCGCQCQQDLITYAYESIDFCGECEGTDGPDEEYCKNGWCAVASRISKSAGCPEAQALAQRFLSAKCPNWPFGSPVPVQPARPRGFDDDCAH